METEVGSIEEGEAVELVEDGMAVDEGDVAVDLTGALVAVGNVDVVVEETVTLVVG